MESKEEKIKTISKTRIITLLILVFGILVIFYISLYSSLKKDVIIHITKNESIQETVQLLKDNDVIDQPKTFLLLSKVFDLNIKTGDYLFLKGSTLPKVFLQLALNDHNIDPIKVTIREGLDNEQISRVIKKQNLNFNEELFLEKTKGLQGKLFPDTYFFYPMTTVEEIISEMNINFKNKTKNLSLSSDELVMASILEGEANGDKDNKIISGILWKRLGIGMPLQVDVDKSTYHNKGLPDYPLNNPGLSSIKAAIDPRETNYLYYLHDNDGNVHYASNYEDHKKNIKLYLK
ncbi:MAG: endolytic transglycosylase MltG [Candidatus Moranbacteria bacterium]|nr:endolytic transglycosylase MltG [Candidatus Moranbacteria bacterium]